MTQDAKVLLAIERLLYSSGWESWNVVSVVDEANKYCFKTVSGKIDAVDKDFIHDRIKAGLFLHSNNQNHVHSNIR